LTVALLLQTTVIAGAATIKTVVTNGSSTLCIASDGSLWAWGYNNFGQLGDGTKKTRVIPTRIGTDTDWVQVVASSSAYGLKTDGSLWAWGSNIYALPDGTYKNSYLPVKIELRAGDGGTGGVSDDVDLSLLANRPQLAVAIADVPVSAAGATPQVTITVAGKTLTRGVDYTVSYKNNTKVGTATVTITGIGKYKGSYSFTFKVVPKKSAIKKVTAGTKKLTVKWKKVSSITKYQVAYRIKGKKAWKTKTISAKKTMLVLKKLKRGKRYQVRVRSYKTIGITKYVSAWSAIKTSKKVK
jgi:hypothetical protein